MVTTKAPMIGPRTVPRPPTTTMITRSPMGPRPMKLGVMPW